MHSPVGVSLLAMTDSHSMNIFGRSAINNTAPHTPPVHLHHGVLLINASDGILDLSTDLARWKYVAAAQPKSNEP